MNGISNKQKPSGPSAASMNGRRRPSGVWKVSLHGPITGESASANTPSDPSTSPISAPDSVKCRRIGGRATEVVVIENASPNAPRPSVQKRLRRTGCERTAASAVNCVMPYAVAGARSGASPPQTISTTVRSAAASSSSPSGSVPSTQPVRISSSAP